MFSLTSHIHKLVRPVVIGRHLKDGLRSENMFSLHILTSSLDQYVFIQRHFRVVVRTYSHIDKVVGSEVKERYLRDAIRSENMFLLHIFTSSLDQ
eukprot:CAMPEP_0179494486 /NCGR_PEP_ID=MMETSP0799-20121207/68195_1 /TAXON_ID=46947 /ORGANISM="Geminigera cryophila, Strain CCMP2564" /LENGTH=94 /DNA_ID=CAMNT_0021312103 /DNA_START=169 /DNA_END=453 /DNA_ORIENTATION=-